MLKQMIPLPELFLIRTFYN